MLSKQWQHRIRIALGLPALFPLIFMFPMVLAFSGSNIAIGVADVLGTGAEFTLFITLLISPLVMVTGMRWLAPLRQWYGIMTAVIAATDATLAFLTTVEFGPVLNRISAHSFLFVGLLMATLLVAIAITSNKRSMRILGKYWAKVQALTYVVWALLGLHLALLFNLGPTSGGAVDHQRFYQYMLCSVPLVVYRLPFIKKSVINLRKAGLNTAVYLMASPWLIMFVLGLAFIINEEVFKGVDIFLGHPSTN